jgi:hypothetical protein
VDKRRLHRVLVIATAQHMARDDHFLGEIARFRQLLRLHQVVNQVHRRSQGVGVVHAQRSQPMLKDFTTQRGFTRRARAGCRRPRQHRFSAQTLLRGCVAGQLGFSARVWFYTVDTVATEIKRPI